MRPSVQCIRDLTKAEPCVSDEGCHTREVSHSGPGTVDAAEPEPGPRSDLAPTRVQIIFPKISFFIFSYFIIYTKYCAL